MCTSRRQAKELFKAFSNLTTDHWSKSKVACDLERCQKEKLKWEGQMRMLVFLKVMHKKCLFIKPWLFWMSQTTSWTWIWFLNLIKNNVIELKFYHSYLSELYHKIYNLMDTSVNSCASHWYLFCPAFHVIAWMNCNLLSFWKQTEKQSMIS